MGMESSGAAHSTALGVQEWMAAQELPCPGLGSPCRAGLEAAALCSLQGSRAAGCATAAPAHLCPVCS